MRITYVFALFLSVLATIQVGYTQQSSSKDSILKELDLEDVVITAQYAPTHSKNAVHQVKVIKAIDIQQQGFNNLSEVLTNQLNLRVSTDPILGNGLSIQGIGGENVQIMIDGIPVIGRVNGNIDLSQINLNNIDRIEIIEGALSAQYGSNASGGVVNIITKKSQLNRIEIESQNQYENIGIWNNSIRIGTQLDKLHASVNVSRYHSQFGEEDELRLYEMLELPGGGTYRSKVIPWNPKIQYGINGLLRYRFSDSTNITYQYRWFDETVSSYGEVRRPQFRPYAFDDFFTTVRHDHNLSFETYLGDKIYLNSTTGFNIYDRLSETQRIDFEPDTTSLVPGAQDTTNFTALLHRSILSTVSQTKLNSQIGVEVLHETGTGPRIIDSTSQPINQALLTNYAAWASLRFQPINTLTLLANLRYGYNTKYDHPLIPSVHASWKPNKNWNFKLSYAHGFRAPSLKELHFNFIDINHFIVGNPDVKAENSRNASLFVEYDGNITTKHKLSLSGKLFYNRIQNRIILAEYAALQFNYQNLDNFETHGLNLQLNYQWGDHLTIKSGYAFTRLYNFWSEDFETDKFTNLPEWQNELRYQIPFIKTNILLTHRYIGRQIRFIEQDGVLDQGFIGDYHLVNATLSRSFWSNRIFTSIGAKNLLDTKAVPSTGQSGGTHSGGTGTQLLNWGRTIFVRINVKLGKY